MVRFHEALARRADRDHNFHFHYVTAREMYNLVRAAETGWNGTVDQARDFELIPAMIPDPPRMALRSNESESNGDVSSK